MHRWMGKQTPVLESLLRLEFEPRTDSTRRPLFIITLWLKLRGEDGNMMTRSWICLASLLLFYHAGDKVSTAVFLGKKLKRNDLDIMATILLSWLRKTKRHQQDNAQHWAGVSVGSDWQRRGINSSEHKSAEGWTSSETGCPWRGPTCRMVIQKQNSPNRFTATKLWSSVRTLTSASQIAFVSCPFSSLNSKWGGGKNAPLSCFYINNTLRFCYAPETKPL